jgi:hypothetical protein
MGESSLIFSRLWFGIYFWLPPGKYKIVEKYFYTYTHGCGCFYHRSFCFEIRIRWGERKKYFHLPKRAKISRNKSTVQNTKLCHVRRQFKDLEDLLVSFRFYFIIVEVVYLYHVQFIIINTCGTNFPKKKRCHQEAKFWRISLPSKGPDTPRS